MIKGIRSLRDVVKYVEDNFLTASGTTTLTNKTITSPIINTPSILGAIESGINLTAANVTLSAAQKIKQVLSVSNGSGTYAIIAPAENRVYLVINNDAANAVTIKKSAGTGCTIPAGKSAVVYYNGTDYAIAADNQVTLTGTETLTNKTLTAPVITSPDLTLGVSSKNYGGAHADWTLSASEMKSTRLIVTNADSAVNAIATPTSGKMYIILNTSGQALTFKATGQTGVTIASTKSAIVIGNGTDFVRVTADA